MFCLMSVILGAAPDLYVGKYTRYLITLPQSLSSLHLN